jgi:hypothetical protein
MVVGQCYRSCLLAVSWEEEAFAGNKRFFEIGAVYDSKDIDTYSQSN